MTEDHLAFFSCGKYDIGDPQTYARVQMLGILDQMEPVHAQVFRELGDPEFRAQHPHVAEE